MLDLFHSFNSQWVVLKTEGVEKRGSHNCELYDICCDLLRCLPSLLESESEDYGVVLVVGLVRLSYATDWTSTWCDMSARHVIDLLVYIRAFSVVGPDWWIVVSLRHVAVTCRMLKIRTKHWRKKGI